MDVSLLETEDVSLLCVVSSHFSNCHANVQWTFVAIMSFGSRPSRLLILLKSNKIK
jgi:hypothetical protein